MILYFFFILIVCILIWVTIWKKEIYPFSWYPMYSGKYSLEEVVVFRLALQNTDGELIWWKSKFYRYPEYVGKKVKQLNEIKSEGKTSVFIDLERNRILLEVLRLIEFEHGSINKYTAFHIIERTTNKLEVSDKTLNIISFKQLKDGRFS